MDPLAAAWAEVHEIETDLGIEPTPIPEDVRYKIADAHRRAFMADLCERGVSGVPDA